MKSMNSEQSPIRIVPILPPSAAGGWLAISLAPGKKTQGTHVRWDRDLSSDLDRLRELGVTTLVPLLLDTEFDRLRIADLGAQTRARDLGCLRFPIRDGGVPGDLDGCIGFIADLLDRRERGERLLVHCNGGLGRAGTVAACALLAAGLARSAEEAIAEVRNRRSRRAIETAEQEGFIAAFSDAWRERGAAAQPVPNPADGQEARRRGAWLGLVVGDALGAPIEFMSPAAIQARFGTWREMAAGGPWKRGEWTDDTALAIAASRAYTPAGYALEPAARAMVDWLDSDPKDVGNQTRATLALLKAGADPRTAGRTYLRARPGAAGNGSLMRAAPTGLVRRPDDPRLAKESEEISAVTHADPRCLAACVAFNTVLSSLVHGGPDVAQALSVGRDACAGRHPEVLDLVDGVIARRGPAHVARPIGYVLLCLELALITLRDARAFESALIEVVNRGGDTDTNGAVAGALLGARFGQEAIPRRWREALRDQSQVNAALDQLLAFGDREGPDPDQR